MNDINLVEALASLLRKAMSDMDAMAKDAQCCRCVHKEPLESGCFGLASTECEDFIWESRHKAEELLKHADSRIAGKELNNV